LVATSRKNLREQSLQNVAAEVTKNIQALSEENISSIATALGKEYDEVITLLELHTNNDGTYRMNVNSILKLIS